MALNLKLIKPDMTVYDTEKLNNLCISIYTLQSIVLLNE